MRSPHFLRPNAVSLNLTPMIDVVFLLIIFFLVSSSLIQQETSLELALPNARTGRRPAEDDSRKEVLNIPVPGSLLLRTTPITLEGLKGYFAEQKKKGKKNIEVVLRTGPDVRYEEVEPILLLCAESGIWNVSFSTVRRE